MRLKEDTLALVCACLAMVGAMIALACLLTWMGVPMGR